MTADSDMLSEANDAFFSALLDDNPTELYENAPCGYFSTIADGTVIKANETFFAWTGYRREESLGRIRFQDLLSPGDRIFFETHYAPMLRMQGSVREIAVELVLADGSRLPVLLNSVVKHNAAGQIELVRTVVFDARERRAYEAELVRARRAAEASEAEARSLAETLRASFTPPVDLDLPGIDVGGAFRPASGTQLGGDFYDVFDTGRTGHAIALGDVCGKGAEAAVITALVRHAIRAEVLRSSSPAEVLRLVHEALLRQHPDKFCTALLLEIETLTGTHSANVTLAVGGHQLPVLARPEGIVRVGRTGSILGMLPAPKLHDTQFELHRADALVLYTDGVPEARRGGEFFGEARTKSLIAEVAGADANTIAKTLADAAMQFQGGRAGDDIAVVAVKLAAA